MNSIILTLKTWLIILQILKLVKHLLKKRLTALNEIKKAKIIKYKRRSPREKGLLNLFNNLLDTILTDKTLKSNSQEDNTLMSSKDENENVNENENDERLMSSKNENKNAKDKKISTNTKKAANKKKIRIKTFC